MSEAYGNKKGTFDVEQPPPTANYGASAAPYPGPQPPIYVVGQTAPPESREPLPCFGLGIGWTMFIIGFIFGIPWYVGAILLCCGKRDKREKPGCIACLVLAVIFTILVIIQVVLTARVHIVGIGIEEVAPSEEPLPCCGLGVGWTLFILGFIIGIPWYIGAVFAYCRSEHPREKAGNIACFVMAVILSIYVFIDLSKGDNLKKLFNS